MTEIYKDILIIGGGPVGIFGAFQAGLHGMNSVIVDSLDILGGQCSSLYPEKPIYDIPGYPEISGQELINQLKKQASPFGPLYILDNQIIKVDYLKEDKLFHSYTSKNKKIISKAILIAGGSGAFGPKKPPLLDIETYEGKSIFYNIQNKKIFDNKIVVIAGGGDSAVDWGIELSKNAKKIYMVHRRDKFRSMQSSYDKMLELAKTGKLELVVPYQLHGLKGEDGNLTNILVKDIKGDLKDLKADYLLPFFGLSMDLGPIREWGLNLHMNHIKVNKVTSETNIEGIYAVGDIARYEGKIKLIMTGFSEVATSIHHMYSRVFDGKKLHFQYSTSIGVPKSE